MKEILNIQGLRRMLSDFKENGRHASYGRWSIARGGYDLWFEVYHNDKPLMGCVDGTLEVYVRHDEYEGLDRAVKIILDVYKDIRMEEEE